MFDYLEPACRELINYGPVILGTLGLFVLFEVTGILIGAIIVRRRKGVST